MRWVLNQSVWMWIRTDPKAKAFAERLAKKHPQYGKRVAVVALMRRRAVRLWHLGLRAQLRAGSFGPPVDPDGDPRAARPACGDTNR